MMFLPWLPTTMASAPASSASATTWAPGVPSTTFPSLLICREKHQVRRSSSISSLLQHCAAPGNISSYRNTTSPSCHQQLAGTNSSRHKKPALRSNRGRMHVPPAFSGAVKGGRCRDGSRVLVIPCWSSSCELASWSFTWLSSAELQALLQNSSGTRSKLFALSDNGARGEGHDDFCKTCNEGRRGSKGTDFNPEYSEPGEDQTGERCFTRSATTRGGA